MCVSQGCEVWERVSTFRYCCHGSINVCLVMAGEKGGREWTGQPVGCVRRRGAQREIGERPRRVQPTGRRWLYGYTHAEPPGCICAVRCALHDIRPRGREVTCNPALGWR